MDERGLVLPGVDPDARRRAEAEAARRNLDLADYLTQVLLRQMASEPTAPRRRLADQVGVLETVVAQQAEIVTEALGKVDSGFVALGARLSETERVSAAGLEELCANADRAARDTEDAAARLLGDLEAMRAGIETRVVLSELETRERMQAEFAQAAVRLDALTEWTHAIESESQAFVRAAVDKVHLETERIEACTLVSLEKLAGDIASVRTDQRSATLQCEGLDQRLARLEAAAEHVVTEQALAVILAELDELKVAQAQPGAARVSGAEAPALNAIEQRVLAMEQTQNDALETLRIQVALFVDANDRRLRALEAMAPIADDLDAELAALRAATAGRIDAVERQCARSLEQIAGAMVALSGLPTNRDKAA